MEVLEFLTLVWGSRVGWVDLPSKIRGHWIPFSASWPEDKPMIRRRVESCLEDEENLYFSISQFKAEGRRIKDTMSSEWLWADLDRVGPDDCAALDLTPTVCWESSPFRYQALWKLDRRLSPEPLARVNRALSYVIGADRGGWDLTQVLRPVGTRNFKYTGGPEVMLVYDDGPKYSARDLWQSVKGADPGQGRLSTRETLHHAVPRAHRDRLPARARALLATPAERVVAGERSTRLWELNCLLAEAGLEEDQIVSLVAPTPWNKWGSRLTRLEADVAKACAHVEGKRIGTNGHPGKEKAKRTAVDRVYRTDELETLDLTSGAAEAEDGVELPFMGYSTFMSQRLEAPRWLIQDLWMAQSHGIIGGDPKSSKSLLSLAMGLSIASGRPFLGDERFAVSTPGPVLIVQEENTPWDVQDKLRKLAALYGLIGKEDVEWSQALEGSVAKKSLRLNFPHEVPLMMLNNYGFDMGEEELCKAMEDAIEEIGAVMVILDPLYLMVGDADTNKAHEMKPLQKWLLSLRYRFGCAVAVVHHFGKPRYEETRRGGHRLLGSGTWYNWVDSAMYCESREPETTDKRYKFNRQLRIEREWRSAAPQAALEIGLMIGEPGDLSLRVSVDKYNLRRAR
jgi:hypothetical protein